MVEFITEYGPVALAALGGLVITLKAIAPLTPTPWDNRVANGLDWVVAKLSGLVSPKVK